MHGANMKIEFSCVWTDTDLIVVLPFILVITLSQQIHFGGRGEGGGEVRPFTTFTSGGTQITSGLICAF